MSLYNRAASLIQSLIQSADQRLRPEIDDVLGDLHVAHRAQTTAVAQGAGQRITIDGSQEAGFLVSIHDGDQFRSYTIAADDPAAALAEGQKRFADEAQEASAPQPQPQLPLQEPATEPAPPLRRVERPFDGDPNTLDVTRGRVGDEDPDPEKRPGAQVSDHERAVAGDPVPPGVSEAAPLAGTHTGNDQAISYEADPVADGAVVQSSPAVQPDQLATSVVHDLPSDAHPVASEADVKAADPVGFHEQPAEAHAAAGDVAPSEEPIVPAAPPASPGEQIEAAEARAARQHEEGEHGHEEGARGAEGG